MTNYDKLFIDGAWTDSDSNERMDVLNPANGEVIGTIALGNAQDVDRAVQAAHQAFHAWANLAPERRAEFINAIADGIERRSEELAQLITAEVGATIEFSRAVQVGWTIQYFRDAAHAISHIKFEQPYKGEAILRKEPVGIVGAITPWNFPLMQSAAKIAPALAAGCTVVLKPSEVAPLSIFALAEIVAEVGLPDGVLNIVNGLGPEVGEALVTHPLVNAVSFTGSTLAGTRVAALAAKDVKRVTLELGGKSGALVLPGADIEAAVRATVADSFVNAGQKCVAHTRLIVPRSDLAKVEQLARDIAVSMKLGDPADPTTSVGPVVSELQRDRVRVHIERAIESGAKLLVGGPDVPEDLTEGYYIRPTVFSEVSSRMPLAQEEVFGPVLAIIPYDSVEEGLEIVNDSEYGLGGGVWASTRDAAIDVARQIRTGQVAINGSIPTADLPFGGFKKSGIGREGGLYAVEEFLEMKTIF